MIFPELNDLPHLVVNLNNEARRWKKLRPYLATHDDNPLLRPDICQSMVDDMHHRLQVAWSYGGWMEDRSVLWAGGYMEAEKRFCHLGVDFNVPAGTEIQTRREVEVVRIDDDNDEEGGWGPRLIVMPKEGEQSTMLIYAHLHATVRCKVGDILSAGQIFAEVGKAPHNGNWFPHLHVQAMKAEHYAHLLRNDLRDLDGYCTEVEKADAIMHFPDPMTFL